MRNGKLFFIVFLVLYFIAGLSLLITGSVAHRHASYCKSMNKTKKKQNVQLPFFCSSFSYNGLFTYVRCGFCYCLRRIDYYLIDNR